MNKQNLQKRSKHFQKRPTKETYMWTHEAFIWEKCHIYVQKRPAKETCKRELQKRPTYVTAEEDFNCEKRPTKRPTEYLDMPPATRCNTLQHTAPHCDALQHTATHCNTKEIYRLSRRFDALKTRPICQKRPMLCTKEHYVRTKETFVCTKETYVCTKETSTRDLRMNKRDLCMHKRDLNTPKQTKTCKRDQREKPTQKTPKNLHKRNLKMRPAETSKKVLRSSCTKTIASGGLNTAK